MVEDSGWYTLDDDNNPVPATLIGGAKWISENPDRKIVEKTKLGDVEVSTIFLGLDHGWTSGTPILFETIIFGGDHDQYCTRYETWNKAKERHSEIVTALRKGGNPDA